MAQPHTGPRVFPSSLGNMSTPTNALGAKVAPPYDLNSPETLALVAKAQESDAIDHALTIRQALHKYKKAVFWAMFLSTSLIMEGKLGPG